MKTVTAFTNRIRKYQSTRLAKASYWLGGKLSRIKWYTQTYRITAENWDLSKPAEKAGRVWLPCRLSMRMLELSMRLDHYHWDHWALMHEECEHVRCEDCGGDICPANESIR